MKCKHYLVTFRHMGKVVARVVEATSRDNAMGCVCGVIISCELCD